MISRQGTVTRAPVAHVIKGGDGEKVRHSFSQHVRQSLNPRKNGLNDAALNFAEMQRFSLAQARFP